MRSAPTGASKCTNCRLLVVQRYFSLPMCSISLRTSRDTVSWTVPHAAFRQDWVLLHLVSVIPYLIAGGVQNVDKYGCRRHYGHMCSFLVRACVLTGDKCRQPCMVLQVTIDILKMY